MVGTSEHPGNIVLIISDDQGPWALGCAGNPEIHTPNLDQLASEGVRFENFFCTSPVCSPARASLFTGKTPSQHGVHDWIAGSQVGPSGRPFLEGHALVTDTLAERGWRVGLSGKWHLGASDVPQSGFDHWFTHQKGGGPYYGAPLVRGTETFTEPAYVTDVFTDDAVAFLDTSVGDERPFFLALCYTAPHSPWAGQHPREFVELYDECEFTSCPQEPDHPWLRRKNQRAAAAEDDPRAALQGYFAAVTAMDAAIGRVVDRLRANGQAEDTLIAFLSDNGFNCGHHGLWGKGNGTYPLNMYDTSVKVPAIFVQPGRVRSGHVEDAMVSGYDLMPTLLDHVGLADAVPPGRPGRSFAGLLDGAHDAAGFDRVVVYDEYGPTRMIRTADWKLVVRLPDGPNELYDLEADPGERVNLVDDPAHAEVYADMAGQLDEWFRANAEPGLDGAALPVTGLGQTHRLRDARGSGPAFRQFMARS